ncbi:MAG: tetratricopeptide repeat protein, partial [Anaerolineaceae bacterium]|nr:tetratricopeptide repeat protein [Anaerolineaceae bacterium]
LITRADPPLHLARRRSRGQLCEVRAAGLRFNLEEAGEFLNHSMQLALEADDVAVLETRTEGWIAGLQLAAISLQGCDNRRSFIASFHGEDRFIADYLVEEVLQLQPEHIQAFLLHTALLQRFNASLCNVVTGRSDSAQILARIEADNLFLLPLDNQRQWFRYHALFARMLQKNLEQTASPEIRSTVLHRASEECIRQGLLVEGVQYLFDAGDESSAAQLIFQLSHVLFQRNELPWLMHWASLLPEKVIGELPGLCISFAWAAHATGNPTLAQRMLELAEAHAGLDVDTFLSLAPTEQAGLPADVLACIVEAVVVKTRLLIDEGISGEVLGRYMRILPWLVAERDDKPFVNNRPSAMRPIMLFQAGMAYQVLGRAQEAIEAFCETTQLARKENNHFLVALGLGYLGQVKAAQGKLGEAQKTWQDALDYASENGCERDAFFSTALVGLGSLAYERNDLQTAAQLLREGISLARSWAAWQGLLPGLTFLAKTLLAQGDSQAAFEALDELHRFNQSAPEMIRPAREACQALLLARQGKPASWNVEWDNSQSQTMERSLIRAEILVLAGNPLDAKEYLEQLEFQARQNGLFGCLVQILVIKTRALQALGNPDEAEAALVQALGLGEQESFIRSFIDQGEEIARLLRQSSRAALDGYRGKLLKAFTEEGISAQSMFIQANASLADPLTTREIEILQRIAQGIDNPTLAGELYISVNTVKKHISHLFDKLGVENRLQAVERARRLGFLQ